MKAGGDHADKCLLFLRLRLRDGWDGLIAGLPEQIARQSPASVLLPEILPRETKSALDLIRAIQRADIAALVRNDVTLAIKLQADGVHLSDYRDCRNARKIVGADMTLGAECPLERHAAMVAGESGADYVAFSVSSSNQQEASELLAWWRDMMVLPCVALIDDTGVAMLSIIAKADFFSPPC